MRLLGVLPAKVITKRQLIPEMSEANTYYHCYPSNPNEEFVPVPDVSSGNWLLHEYTFEKRKLDLSRLSETPWCVQYEHSSKGIRDREYEVPCPDGIQRIAVVGDSFVFGEGVQFADTLPQQLAKVLGDNYECVNAGQVGANAEQEMLILDAVTEGAGCQSALLVLIPNDIPLTPELSEQQDYINDFILIRDRYLEEAQSQQFLMGYSQFLDLLMTPRAMAKIRNDTIEWYHDCYSEERNRRNLEWLQSQLNTLATREDSDVAIILYPLLENLEDDYPLQDIHDLLSKMAEKANLPVLDLAPIFAGQNSRSLWVHETDHHPNRSAHAMAAVAIADWINHSKPFSASPAPKKAGN